MNRKQLDELCSKIWHKVYPCGYQIAIGHNGKQVQMRVDSVEARNYTEKVMEDNFPDVMYDMKVIGKIRPL